MTGWTEILDEFNYLIALTNLTLTAPELTDSPATNVADPNLARSMGDAACFGGMVGCGETYFPAFALAVGLGETAAGLVASVPLLVGGLIQLGSPYGIERVGGYRRWIVLGASLQGLAFLPLAIAAWHATLTLPMMLLIASIYWAAGLATGPAWNTWIEQIVPSSQRTKFFSRRSSLQQATTFASLLIAGLCLHWASEKGAALAGFATLFCVAAGLRWVSAGFLQRTRETETRQDEIAARAIVESENDPVGNRAAMRLLTYLVAMQVFIQLSGPYFVPYMLGQLQFGYGIYVSLIAAAFLSKVLSLTFWGRVAERSGASKVLWMGGIGLVPLAALWIVSSNLYWLIAIQILSGIAWAAYELGFFLMFFETLPANQRTRLLTYYNLANASAICLGALAGAAMLATMGSDPRTYYWLFAISSIGRMLCLGLLTGVVLPKASLKTIRLRILSVRPGAGSVTAPIIASAEE